MSVESIVQEIVYINNLETLGWQDIPRTALECAPASKRENLCMHGWSPRVKA